MPTLEVAELSKRFRADPRRPAALETMSFRFDGPGAVACLGPNGAGKSTLLKLLVGLLHPTTGTILLNGVDLAGSRKHALWDVGAVIERPEPYPTQTVGESLRMVGRFRGLGRATLEPRIRALAEELELPPLGARNGALSKGQGQRVVLAAALLADPKVVLLDEPESGLDLAERVILRQLLKRLRKDHLVLLSSHNMGEVTHICEELLFLDRGRLILRARTEEVLARVRAREVDVEFSQPVARDRLETLVPGLDSVVALSDRRFRLAFDGTDRTRAELHAACARLAPLISFSNTSLLLEEAYLSLMATGEAG
jgi:ABC-2 type transport system ATP-binding protein